MIAKKKPKKKVAAKKQKRVTMHVIPNHVLAIIKCAAIYERTIVHAVQELQVEHPTMSIHSAGLALALSAITYPDHKLFASMVADIKPSVLNDFKNIKPFVDNIVPSKKEMH